MRCRTLFLCLLVAAVAACGGGGGDPAASSTPPPAATPVFALTEANAVQAAAYALAPLEQLLPAGTLAMNAAAFMRVLSTSQFATSCGGVSIDITYTDRDASGNVSVGDVINVPAVDCGGSRRAVTLTLTQFPTTLESAAGRADIDIQDATGMRVVGTFDIAVSVAPPNTEVTWRITNASVTVTQSSTTQTVRLESGQFTFSQTNYSFRLTGGSVASEHLGGNYSFATTAPFAGAARRLPSSGTLELTTSGGSRARIAPPATPSSVEETVEYSIAPTSTGAFGPARQTVWTTIIRGALFSWRPNEAPTLTNLAIQPANPSPGASLSASYSATDINGDTLQTTIEWRRNGAVIGTGQALYATTARNDQITVTVTVSDGRLSTTATASTTIGNPPPQVTLTLTPAQPDTAVDLVAVPAIFEPDGDPVTTTYEWSRNGAVIASQTAATLPASFTTRHDVISVRVRASDGASTVEATATATIVDAPARVSVLSPPATVVYGTPVTFTATVDDPDGDEVDDANFVLAYGPAGMTVDSATGEVSWTPSGPMFDRTMDIGWGITTDGPTVQLGTGTIEVTDSTRDYPLLRFGTHVPNWPSGLSVADLDGDGTTEMMIMGSRWLFELQADGSGGYVQTWAYPYSLSDPQYSYNQSMTALATADIDGDGHHEVFAAAGQTIVKLDGATRRPAATTQLGTYEGCADLILADLENDGSSDLICLATADYWASTARILVLRSEDLSLRHESAATTYGRSLAVGNVDTDSALEIVTAGGYVFDGRTLANQWLYSQGFGMDVDTGDLDGDGIEEIIGAADWSFVRGFTTQGPEPMPVSPIWEVAHFDLDSLLVADIGGDARPEIIVGDGQWGDVTLYRYDTATNSLDVVDRINSQDHGVTAIGVGDVDDDGELEFVWGTGASSSGADELVIAGRNPTLAVEWTNEDPVQLDGPFIGGALAGSVLAPPAPLFLVSQTNSGYDGARLVRMPTDGSAIEVDAELASNWARTGALDVVDFDNDGTEEAFVATSVLYDGLFRVRDFFTATDAWSSPQLPHQATIDVTHADLTGDGRAELIGMTTTGVVYAYDVYHSAVVWQSTTLGGGRRVLAVNLDGDAGGTIELVAVTPNTVHVYRRNTSAIPYLQVASYRADREIVDADIGDMDGDGGLEVVLLLGEWYASGSDVVTLSSALLVEPAGSFELPWNALTLDIEPSSSPRKNLLMSRRVGDGVDSTMMVVGGTSGGIVFESPPLVGHVMRDSIHYVTLPGETQPRISIGTSGGMYLTR